MDHQTSRGVQTEGGGTRGVSDALRGTDGRLVGPTDRPPEDSNLSRGTRAAGKVQSGSTVNVISLDVVLGERRGDKTKV